MAMKNSRLSSSVTLPSLLRSIVSKKSTSGSPLALLASLALPMIIASSSRLRSLLPSLSIALNSAADIAPPSPAAEAAAAGPAVAALSFIIWKNASASTLSTLPSLSLSRLPKKSEGTASPLASAAALVASSIGCISARLSLPSWLASNFEKICEDMSAVEGAAFGCGFAGAALAAAGAAFAAAAAFAGMSVPSHLLRSTPAGFSACACS
mmetsp:Transcript_34113/g.80530  ORF Transcript_34113/g.80530 Transcript_34113/m.80530 type:complete len:210 (+) Transcript_34113:175-804(+)